jgi:hypothetical protein
MPLILIGWDPAWVPEVACGEEEISCHTRESNHDSSSVQVTWITVLTELSTVRGGGTRTYVHTYIHTYVHTHTHTHTHTPRPTYVRGWMDGLIDWLIDFNTCTIHLLLFSSVTNLHKTNVKHLNYKLYYRQLHLKYFCILARYWLQAPWEWHDSVETGRSVIICGIIVHLLVIVQNKKGM